MQGEFVTSVMRMVRDYNEDMCTYFTRKALLNIQCAKLLHKVLKRVEWGAKIMGTGPFTIQCVQIVYILSERKRGFFVKVKEDKKF